MRVLANTLTGRMTQAADAVRVTPGNVGASGLAVGSIACRSTLGSPSNGCLPLNVFGEGVASPETIAWINSYDDIDDEDITLNQDVAAASMQGVLPWGLSAGKVAVAFGAEYRKEGGRTVADPRANAAQWASGNFADFAGQYHVEEGFLQVDRSGPEGQCRAVAGFQRRRPSDQLFHQRDGWKPGSWAPPANSVTTFACA